MSDLFHLPNGKTTLTSDMTLGWRTRVEGVGAHDSILEMRGDAQLIIDARDAPDAWQLDMHDFQVRVTEQGRSAPIVVLGKGTENGCEGLNSIRRVQFGSPDKRSPSQGGLEQPTPASWLELSGVFGLHVTQCNFAGDHDGPLDDPDSYWPRQAILLSERVGIITDVDGSQYLGRTMGLTFEGCHVAPGCQVFLRNEPQVWYEGVTLRGNRIRGVWDGIELQSDETMPGAGLATSIVGNHIAFRHSGYRQADGTLLMDHNQSIMALPGGELEAHVVLGAENGTGVIHSNLTDNMFGFAIPSQLPEYAIMVIGASSMVLVADNQIQGLGAGMKPIWFGPDTFKCHFQPMPWDLP